MRLRLLGCALIAVLTAAMLGTPADAASKKPGTVGLVSVTGASTYASGGKQYAKVKLAWPRATRAKKYQVFVAYSREKVSQVTRPRATVKSPKATITKLKRNRTYWFQVRAVNGKSAGKRSARIARVTPTASASLDTQRHPAYRLMSYNVCSNACSRWQTRLPLVVSEVQRLRPDVLAVQEASQWRGAVIPGYTETLGGKDNRIFYRTAAFEQVQQELPPEQESAECPVMRDSRNRVLRDDEGEPVPVDPCVLPLDGITDPPGKAAPWAMLRHRASGQEVLFVGAHLLTGSSNANARYRASQANDIFTQLQAQLDWWGRSFARTPIVVLGDFNTNRSRSNHALVETAMKRFGFWDSYEQAQSLSRQHMNTANPKWLTKPVIGVTWGDHVDKVWVRPGRTRVLSWTNAGKMAGGRFVAPLPSDHHPLLVRAQVS
ncbi:hypothetical protein AFL01nite_08700 [Aeromicrobium flavum]|uniref:Fibronectin type-III domain-containing protein n=1 Tax=Aeromicrobium flavum TaxID=416568 RepID=A0A512HSV5_9ACTN|nr:endonuclease/exonuclease/phosphatase family protein [Aeromicrobium flavum]GEO88543.1 hypothetical protein AFL01nite_08700 [Aeromicrobium flavum]